MDKEERCSEDQEGYSGKQEAGKPERGKSLCKPVVSFAWLQGQRRGRGNSSGGTQESEQWDGVTKGIKGRLEGAWEL